MIKSLTFTNYLGQSLTMDLRNPEKSGFLITSIDGLGPVAGTVNMTEIVTSDGAQFNSARQTYRNIVTNLIFLWTGENEKYSIETTRLRSYKMFPIKSKVTILIETDNRIAETYGYVESNEPTIFSNQEGTQISILCPDSCFKSAGIDGERTIDFSSVVKGFEFPFSNESISEKLIQLGDIVSVPEKDINYNGDAEVGVIIELYATGTVENPVIRSTSSNTSFKINTSKITNGFVYGDTIQISTIKGEKYIRLLRNGVYYNILNAIDMNSDWFQLSYGDNWFTIDADSGADKMLVKIKYRVLYEGL